MANSIRLGALLLAALALPALAQPAWRGERHQRMAERRAAIAEYHALRPEPYADAEFPRDGRPHRGRLSPEERRQLRRDILDAGSGLYRRPPPPPLPYPPPVLPPPPPPLP